jgi:type I restriction enzyme M protein
VPEGGEEHVTTPAGFEDKVAFVWKVADKLRGNLRPHEYGQVMLPMLVLTRLDAVLAPTKAAVLAKAAEVEASGISNPDKILRRAAGQPFYNTSPLDLEKVIADPKNVAANLRTYINGFSPTAVEVLEEYRFDGQITRLDKAGILYPVLGDFVDLDLHPDTVSNEAMGYIFEELLRKFSEMSNETAGEHYTPREVIRLMVNLLFAEDTDALTGPAPVRTIYDPAAGTGGMLTGATEYLKALNPKIQVEVYGQELNPETWAIARSDLMMKGADADRMVQGNSLTQDGWSDKHFDYMLANPPYGVDWKGYAEPIKDEAERLGFNGRFGAGLPRVSDGSFLFLQHMLSKMKPVDDRPETPWTDGGSKIGIVLSGSPLFAGGAGSGESEIRRWIIENDLLEGIVALPDQMFYNTGINTYVWILTNRKPAERRGKVILVDARAMGTKVRKTLGDKRKELTNAAIAEISGLFTSPVETVDSRLRVLSNEDLGYVRLTVERPLRCVWSMDIQLLEDEGFDIPQEVRLLDGALWRSEAEAKRALVGAGVAGRTATTMVKALCLYRPDAEPLAARKGTGLEPDPALRDQENIPLPSGHLTVPAADRVDLLIEAAEAHLRQNIHPFVPDAWIDHSKTKVGYEIALTRQFFVETPTRDLEEINAEMKDLETQIQAWIEGLAK